MTDYEEIYRRYGTDVLRVCYFYLGNRQKAEDVTQDVFVKLLTSQPELEEGKEKSWLFKVALNRCRDLWRSSWARRVILGSPAFELVPAPDDFEKHDEEEAVMKAIHDLPAGFRDIVLLYYYQNMGIAEIAKTLDVPQGTISSRLSRARAKLGDLLKGGCDDE